MTTAFERPASTYQGACACGSVQFWTDSEARTLHCHCSQCRRLSGAAFTTWASFEAIGFSVTGEAALTVYAATLNVKRHFCRTCGTHVFSHDARLPEMVGVPAGVLTAGPALAPWAHCYASDRAPWCVLGDGLPRFDGWPAFPRLDGLPPAA